jgi:hypothetical protein
MSAVQTLHERWAEMRAAADRLQAEADAQLSATREGLASAQQARDALAARIDGTWPDQVIQYIPPLWKLNFSTWRAAPRGWLVAHRREVQATFKAALDHLRWQLAADERLWSGRHEEAYKRLEVGVEVAEQSWEALTKRLAAFSQPLDLARQQAAWLLQLPLPQIIRPKGIAKYLPLGRGKTHYRRSQLASAISARRQYDVAVRAGSEVLAWVPEQYREQVWFESLKVKFYRTLLRPRRKTIAQLMEQIETIAAVLEASPEQQVDLDEMRRLAGEIAQS